MCVVLQLCNYLNEDYYDTSSAGTNLKVGGGHTFVVPLHFFGSTSTIGRFGERFRVGQYSLVSFLFDILLRTVPPRALPFVKVRSTCPPYPIDSASLVEAEFIVRPVSTGMLTLSLDSCHQLPDLCAPMG